MVELDSQRRQGTAAGTTDYDFPHEISGESLGQHLCRNFQGIR